MATNPASRRDFFTRPFASSESPLVEPEPDYFVVYTRRAMACEWEVRLPASRERDAAPLVMSALDEVHAVERQLTVYDETSEVSQLNRTAAARPVRVGLELFSLFSRAGELHRDSGGAYDITSGPLSQVWGFSKRAGRLPSDEELAAARARIGWNHVILDDARSTVAYAKPGVEVNFNSIGKGYGLDRMATLLCECENFLLHGGRSTLVARGASLVGASGWTVGLRHPLRPADRIAEFTLRNQALSTSGSGTQFFRHRGKRYGHLLDPRTGWPAEGMYSATVIAPNATLADALSTAFYVMGVEATLAYCEQHPEISALLVVPGEHAGEVTMVRANL